MSTAGGPVGEGDANEDAFALDTDDNESDPEEEDDETTPSSRKRKSRDGDEDEGLGVHMLLSEQERQWALQLKEALNQNDETRDIPVSDFELAEYAMVEKGNIPKCVERIKNMYQFRTSYGIQETAEEGMACLRAFIVQQPGFILSVDQCARRKHFVHVMDFKQFQRYKVRLESDWRVFLKGIHYLMQTGSPHLSAVRNGRAGIVECDGMGWAGTTSASTLKEGYGQSMD